MGMEAVFVVGGDLNLETITVTVYGSRKRLLPDGDWAKVPYVSGETVEELLTRLGISQEDVWMLTVNNQGVERDHTLSAGDEIGIMCPVEGG